MPLLYLSKKNIILIHGFKDYCALLFMKGALLKDGKKILIQQTANVQVARQIRFRDSKEIVKLKTVIKAYIKKAILIENAGLKAMLKPTANYKFPDEFQSVLNQMPELEKAFNKLTPGRQRGYLLYFSFAKQSKTRSSRIEKYIQKILDGKGLND